MGELKGEPAGHGGELGFEANGSVEQWKDLTDRSDLVTFIFSSLLVIRQLSPEIRNSNRSSQKGYFENS